MLFIEKRKECRSKNEIADRTFWFTSDITWRYVVTVVIKLQVIGTGEHETVVVPNATDFFCYLIVPNP